MFGSEPRVRKPVLLLLVFGVLLVLVGITATAQAVMVSAYASTSTFSVDRRGRCRDRSGLRPAGPVGDSTPTTPIDADRRRERAARDAPGEGRHRATPRSGLPDGRILASSTPGLARRGSAAPAPTSPPRSAGEPRIALLERPLAEAVPWTFPASVLQEYLPLRQGDRTVLVVALWRDAVPVLSRLDGLRRDVVLVTLTAALIAAGVLFLVFRSAQATIQRQTAALVEATRLDPLTGAAQPRCAGRSPRRGDRAGAVSRGPLGVALVDVDNFRLLNDNHGHAAGDETLLRRCRGARPASAHGA